MLERRLALLGLLAASCFSPDKSDQDTDGLTEGASGEPTEGWSTGASSDSDVGTSSTSAGSSGSDEAGLPESAGSSSTEGEPVEPCQVDNGGCDPDALCSTTLDDEIVCTCKGGFVGDGWACTLPPATPTLRLELACIEHVEDTICTTSDGNAQSGVLIEGTPGLLYTASLRLRGLVELTTYEGGEADGVWHADGAPIAGDGFNVTALEVSDPPAVYRFNSGVSGVYACEAIDISPTIEIAGGASVTLTMITNDARMISNHQSVVPPGVPPAPAAFDGQFVQLDVIDIAARQ